MSNDHVTTKQVLVALKKLVNSGYVFASISLIQLQNEMTFSKAANVLDSLVESDIVTVVNGKHMLAINFNKVLE